MSVIVPKGGGAVAPLTLTSPSATTVPLTINGATGQTALLLNVGNLFTIPPSGIPNFNGPTAATATAGTLGAAPAQVGGYIQVLVNGNPYRIPVYTP